MLFYILCLMYGLISLIAASVAIGTRRWWTALLMPIGCAFGFALAVLPIWLSMQNYTIETGYDAGNGGVLFVCTVPVFPIIGLMLGLGCGYLLDEGRRRKVASDLKGAEDMTTEVPEFKP
ncbi:MAG: hypothetical protein O7G85_13505 [Planctomycetota bacterium]|nr:hypothetical protein [Planctomycetota bacterium]